MQMLGRMILVQYLDYRLYLKEVRVELDLIIWIEWDHNKIRIALTQGVDQYEIIEKAR